MKNNRHQILRLKKKIQLVGIILILLATSSCSTANNKKQDSMGNSSTQGGSTGQISPTIQEQSNPSVTISPETLLEQAVNWGNTNLFDDKKTVDEFTHEVKQIGDKKYNFFLVQEKGSVDCSLYYVKCDTGGNLRKLIFCGSGSNTLFSYDVITLNAENYVSVYCASHTGEGSLNLYPLDNEDSASYQIANAIDNYYEEISLVNDDGYDYVKSQVYYDGKLTADYTDVNQDGYTDIVLSGIILQYEAYPDMEYSNSYGTLTDSSNCKRTYIYHNNTKKYELSDETLKSIDSKDGSSHDYTGYLDIHPLFAEGNPRFDYDDDGKLDRVYREFDKKTGNSSYYLHFGNGSKLLLSNISWGFFYKTESVDLTGDGVKEILFEQYSTSTKCQNLYMNIFTLKNKAYEKMDIPYYGEPDSNGNIDGMLYLPLIMKKKDDNSVNIYQPDSDYQGSITANSNHNSGETFNEMEHLYFPENEGLCQYIQASEMSLVDTKVKGKKAFLFRSYLGDKWCNKSILWKLEYTNDSWKITGVYQKDPIK